MQVLSYFKTMMGPHGLYQHATLREPLLREGYCTDDNTRAVQTLLFLKQLASLSEQAEIELLLTRCWQFIVEAEEAPGSYYNFRTSSGEWLPHGRSDDMYARLVRMLLTVIDHDENQTRRQAARTMLEAHLPTVAKLTAPRAWAEILLAVTSSSAATRQQFALEPLITHGCKLLHDLWDKQATEDWPWFEPTMTYANALLPHGLLTGIKTEADDSLTDILHRSANFLRQATIANDMFIPIGSNGWYPKGGTPSRDNQQPIEAGTTFDFFLDYYQAFPDRLSLAQVAAPYLWFWGKNTLRVQLAQPDGASYDSLFLKGPNKNCGAESMLAYLWAEVRLRDAPASVAAYIAAERARLQAQDIKR